MPKIINGKTVLTDAEIDKLIASVSNIKLDTLIKARNILYRDERMGLNLPKDSELFQAIEAELIRRK